MVKKKIILFRKIIEVISKIIAYPISFILSILGIFLSSFGRYSELSKAISFIPFYVGEFIRYFYYKFTIKSVGENVKFKFGTAILYRKTEIGNDVLLGYHCQIGEAKIGNDVIMGSHINILSGLNQHSFDDPNKLIRKQQKDGRKLIIIGSDLWIGSNCIIAVNIGDRCVIGVNSLVVSEIKSHSLAVGSPARIVKSI